MSDAPFLPRPPDPHRICGPAPVRALFLRRPQQVLRLFYTEEWRRLAGPLCKHLARTRRPYREVGPEELTRIAGTQHHGGICAVAVARFAEPLPGHALPANLPQAALLPVLDGIGNPHNLGAIARSAAFFGARALVLSADPRQADLSDAAFRTAEGGLEHLEVLRARDLPNLLKGMRGRFLTVAAVAAGGARPEADPARPPDRPGPGQRGGGPVAGGARCLRGPHHPARQRAGGEPERGAGRGGAVPCPRQPPAPQAAPTRGGRVSATAPAPPPLRRSRTAPGGAWCSAARSMPPPRRGSGRRRCAPPAAPGLC